MQFARFCCYAMEVIMGSILMELSDFEQTAYTFTFCFDPIDGYF